MRIKPTLLREMEDVKNKEISDAIVKLVDDGLDTDEAVNQYIKDNPDTSDVTVAKALKANPINNAADAAYINESSVKIKVSEFTKIVEEECRGYLESLLPHEEKVDLEEGNPESRQIKKLENAMKLVEMSVHEVDMEHQPDIYKNLDMAMKVLNDLYESMHDNLPNAAGLE